MEYVLVQNNKIVETQIPEVGILADGRHVSGFDKLDPAVLKQMGWLPVQDSGHPAIDETANMLNRKIELKNGTVVATYEVIPFPRPTPQLPTPQEQMDALTDLLVSKGVLTKADVAATKVPKTPPQPR